MRQRLHDTWRRIIEPSKTVTAPDIRRQARLLTTMIVILLTALILTYALPLLFQTYPIQSGEVVIMVSGSIAWLVAIWLTKQGRYQAGAKLLVFSIAGILFGNTYISDGLTPDWTMYYLIVPILCSSIFLSARYTMGFVVANVVGMVILVEFIPDYSHSDLPIIFLMVSSALIIAFDQHRKKLEADRQAILRESEDRYRTLYEAISDAIAVTENGQLRDVNPAFERLFGTTCPQVYDDEITRFVSLSATDHPEEVVAHRVDGTPFYAEIRTQQVHHNTANMKVSSIRDITDRKLAAKRDIDLALEREKVTLMQQFIKDASHDLRTPLSVIYTSIHLLKKQDGLNDRGQRHVNTLEKQARLLNEIIENLINLDRLDKASHNRMAFVSSDLNKLLNQIVEEQRPYAETKAITLQEIYSPDMMHIMIDREEIRRAVRQLLTNAIRYTPEAGQVRIHTMQAAETISIQVIDTGIGIAPEDQQRIFDLFYRADSARQSDSGGMGIGLNICQRIVEAHDGHIEIDSVLDEGTTFTMHLPIREAAAVD